MKSYRLDWVRKGFYSISACVLKFAFHATFGLDIIECVDMKKSNNEQMQFRRRFHSRAVVWRGMVYGMISNVSVPYVFHCFYSDGCLLLLLFVYFTFNVFQFRSYYLNSVSAHTHTHITGIRSVRLFVYYKFILNALNMNTVDLANVHCLLFAIINHK